MTNFASHSTASPLRMTRNGRRVLIIVQNLPVPFDRRVWQEASELAAHGYQVSIICPKGRGHERTYEYLNGIHIYRHPLPYEAKGALGYLLEYSWCLAWEFMLALWVMGRRGFDVIHACNPPDDIFIIGGFFKFMFGKKFLFDHHDISPELYEAKFGRRDFFYKVMLFWERLTFRMADVSIATNQSYRKIAIERGRMPVDKVFIVRSGPSLDRLKIIPPVEALRMGKKFLVGYVGVMGQQEGIQYLIEAARHIVYDLCRTDIHFTLVGGGPALEDFKALAAAKKLGDYMTFTGRADEQTLLEVLNTADICANPDEANPMNDKSTMNKIVEYMALGKPIVQFDLTEGRFSAGEASLYAKANDALDFADKIIELIDNPAKRASMGAFGRARVERELAWPYEAPKLLAAYDAIFADK
ncbi:MAG: glycosyltransferase family 4 protein [Alphaproteobacteria bacterium]|nr:glycosyltransferase family 4 protein [Alphaproteobacteria bacterium]